MTRTISNRSRLIETTVALSLLVTLSLIGCGTDISTAPGYVAIENDDGAAGEVPIPARRERVAAPISLTLVEISAGGGTLSWIAADAGLTAHIELNGVRIASVNASDQRFTDNLAKHPGMYTYGVCFESSKKKLGTMKFVEGEVRNVPQDEGRTDDRPEGGQ